MNKVANKSRSNQMTRSLTVAFGIALSIAMGSAPSRADSTMAAAGRAVAAADQGCFTPWYSAIVNTCSSTKSFDIPLTLSRFGNFIVRVTAFGATLSNTVGCAAYGMDKTMTTYWGGAMQYLPAFGVSQDITLTTYVPDQGGLFASCQVYSGGRIHVVNWW